MKMKDVEFFLLIVTAIGTLVPGGVLVYEFSKEATTPERLILLGVIVLCFLLTTLFLGWRTRNVLLKVFRWAGSTSKRVGGFIRQNLMFVGSLTGVCLLLCLLQRQTQDTVLVGIAASLILACICVALGGIRLLTTIRPSSLGLSPVPSQPWCYDFIQHFDDPTTIKSCRQPWQIQVIRKAQSLGIARQAIFEHPPASGKNALRYIVEQIPYHVREVQLQFFTGILDEIWDEKEGSLKEASKFDTVPGNRIRFEISVNEGLVFHEERGTVGWSELRRVGPLVPVNNALNVSFHTDAMGHPEWNWAAWGEPRLVEVESKYP